MIPRRAFLGGAVTLGGLGLLSVRPHSAAAEPPPETTARARKLDVDVGTGDAGHGAHETRGSLRILQRGDEQRAIATQID